MYATAFLVLLLPLLFDLTSNLHSFHVVVEHCYANR